MNETMLPLAQQSTASFFESVLKALEAALEGIPIALLGIIVVFIALALISSFIALLPRAIALQPHLTALLARRKPLREAQAESPTEPANDELSPEMLVVIAAAVAESISEPHRIVHARELTPEDIAWSLEGRMQHHGSHRVQHKNR